MFFLTSFFSYCQIIQTYPPCAVLFVVQKYTLFLSPLLHLTPFYRFLPHFTAFYRLGTCCLLSGAETERISSGNRAENERKKSGGNGTSPSMKKQIQVVEIGVFRCEMLRHYKKSPATGGRRAGNLDKFNYGFRKEPKLSRISD